MGILRLVKAGARVGRRISVAVWTVWRFVLVLAVEDALWGLVE